MIKDDTSVTGPLAGETREELKKSAPSLQYFIFNGKRIELEVDNPESFTLDEVLSDIASQLCLHPSIQLQACSPSSNEYFDRSMKFSEILEKINDDHLLVYIDNISMLSEFASTNSQSKGKVITRVVEKVFKKDMALTTEPLPYTTKAIGTSTVQHAASDETLIISIDEGYVLIPMSTLRSLRENFEPDPILNWINRLVGVFFGICAGFIIPLMDSKTNEPLRFGVTGAFLVSLIVLILLLLFEHKIESRQKNRLESALKSLATGRKNNE